MNQVVLRTVPSIRVASFRAQLAAFGDQKETWGVLKRFVMDHKLPPLGPTLTEYFSMEPIDLAVCWPIDAALVLPAHDKVVVRDLAPATMAVYTHKGAMQDITKAYEVIMPWVENSTEFEQAGPSREVYAKVPFGEDVESGDWNNVVVEVHVPVKPKAKTT